MAIVTRTMEEILKTPTYFNMELINSFTDEDYRRFMIEDGFDPDQDLIEQIQKPAEKKKIAA